MPAFATTAATLHDGPTLRPLAEPALLGVSSGAALGAVIAIYFGVAAISPLAGPLMGMIGGLAACVLTFSLGSNFGRGGGTVALVLAGARVVEMTPVQCLDLHVCLYDSRV